MPLLTAKELQEKLKVSRTAIANWMKDGMPYEKLGKLVRFEDDKVMEWLRERGKEMK